MDTTDRTYGMHGAAVLMGKVNIMVGRYLPHHRARAGRLEMWLVASGVVFAPVWESCSVNAPSLASAGPSRTLCAFTSAFETSEVLSESKVHSTV